MRVPNYCIIALVAMLLIGVAAWQGRRVYVNDALETTLESWDAAGGQTLVAALGARRVYTADNAAWTYRQAFDLIGTLTSADLPVLQDPYGATDAQLRETLVRVAPGISMLSGVGEATVCAWPIRYDEGLAAQRPHLSPAKLMSEVLIAAAVLHVRQGQLQAAADSLAMGLTLADSIAADPLLISNAASRGMDRAVLVAMERLFATDDQTDLTHLGHMLAERSYRDSMLRGLMAEGAIWLNHVRLPAYDHGSRYSLVPADLRRDTTAYLRTLLDLASRLDRPAYAPALPGVVPDPPAWASLLLQVRDRLEELSYLIAEDEARLIQARVALELREYKAQHGVYPEYLAECGLVPQDPISGQVIRYESTGDVFSLSAAQFDARRPAVTWSWQ